MRYYKIWFGEEGWEYYQLHSDDSYAYWHKLFQVWKDTTMSWEARTCFHDEVEVSKLEIIAVLGARALK